jgi:hypothetical protein
MLAKTLTIHWSGAERTEGWVDLGGMSRRPIEEKFLRGGMLKERKIRGQKRWKRKMRRDEGIMAVLINYNN